MNLVNEEYPRMFLSYFFILDYTIRYLKEPSNYPLHSESPGRISLRQIYIPH